MCKTTSKFDSPMMGTAYQWGAMSSCERKKVGAILAKDNRVLNVAYNGTISGADNLCEIDCPQCKGNPFDKVLQEGCERCQGAGIISNPNVVHAEKNLIAFCAKNGIPTDGCTVYVTLSPCIECSSLMKQAGIQKIVYDEVYRDTSGIEFCEQHGIEVVKFKEQ